MRFSVLLHDVGVLSGDDRTVARACRARPVMSCSCISSRVRTGQRRGVLLRLVCVRDHPARGLLFGLENGTGIHI